MSHVRNAQITKGLSKNLGFFILNTMDIYKGF